MYETILVPTDGSDHSVRAAEHASQLAEAFDATVHVVHVVDVETLAGPFSAGGVDESYVEQLKADGQDALDAVETALPTDDVETAQIEGSPAAAILQYADEHAVGAIAMGTHGRTGIDRYVAGSVTERVVRQATVPVLTTRVTDRSDSDSYDDVLVPTDGSTAAGAAVEHGIAIAAAFDATVHAVNVVDVNTISARADYTPPTRLLEELTEAGETATERVAERAREAEVDVVTAVTEGFPARDLLEYAETEDVDLVAMGTAGRTGLNRFLLGSTTERLIRHAEMPVLAVNARDEDEA